MGGAARKPDIAELISRHRLPLMGLSVLWIIVFHSSLYVVLFPGATYLNFLHDIGYFGVDVFFLLSGMGLVRAQERRRRPWPAFFGRRFQRLFPGYWLLLALFYGTLALLGESFSPTSAALEAIGLNFVLQADFHLWYIDCILLFYLAFPGVFWAFGRFRNKLLFVGLVLLVAVGLALAMSATVTLPHLLIFVLRWPTFVLGMALGHELGKAPEARAAWVRRPTLLLALAFFGGLSALFLLVERVDPLDLWGWGLWWYPTLVMALPFAALCAKAFDRLANFVRAPLAFVGARSLEIYVAQVLLFSLLRVLQRRAAGSIDLLDRLNDNGPQLLALALAVLLGVLVSYAVAPVVRALSGGAGGASSGRPSASRAGGSSP